MRTIPIDDWKKISVQERNEILERANSPTIIQLLIQALHKWLEEEKSPPLLDTKIFGYKDSYKWRQKHVK